MEIEVQAKAYSNEFSCGVGLHLTNQDQVQVHHVGPGGTGDDQIAEFLEKRVRIVVPERIGGLRIGARHGCAVGHRARGIGRTVRAVGARAEDENVFEPRDLDRGGEGEFLVASALARISVRAS